MKGSFMSVVLLKSKIHRAVITDADLNYVGSITIDKALMKEVNLFNYEQVHVVNVNNGKRFITYAMEGETNSGIICLNGAAARLGAKGDIVIIMAFQSIEIERAPLYQPKIVIVDHHNKKLCS